MNFFASLPSFLAKLGYSQIKIDHIVDSILKLQIKIGVHLTNVELTQLLTLLTKSIIDGLIEDPDSAWETITNADVNQWIDWTKGSRSFFIALVVGLIFTCLMTIIGRVSVQGVKSLGGHFHVYARGLIFMK